MLELRARKKVGSPHGAGGSSHGCAIGPSDDGEELIRSLHEGLLADWIRVSLVKFCAWFGVPRRTVYYGPTKAAPKVDLRFAEPIKAMIEEDPSFGYRTVAFLLGFNKNTVQRIFQLKHWQVRKCPIGMRPRIQALPSVATAPNERWSTDLCRIWAGKDGWTSLALVIDCHARASRLGIYRAQAR